jgi:hypothetical protein
VTTSVTATAALQEAAGVVAAEEAKPPLIAEQDRIARLRAHLTLNENPELARWILEHVAKNPYVVVRRELERSRGREAVRAIKSLLDAGLLTLIIADGKTRLRISNLVDSPSIYEKPGLLQRENGNAFHLLEGRVAWDPNSGFLLNVENPTEWGGCEDAGIRALVEPKGGENFEVTVSRTMKFAHTSHADFAARGEFTVTPTVFRACFFRTLKPGVPRVELAAPKQPVTQRAGLALA